MAEALAPGVRVVPTADSVRESSRLVAICPAREHDLDHSVKWKRPTMWQRIRLNAYEETRHYRTDDCMECRTDRCVDVSVSAIATKAAFLFLMVSSVDSVRDRFSRRPITQRCDGFHCS